MKKLIFILIFLAMINIVNAQQENQCALEPTPKILWNIYSKIPAYAGNNEQIIKAALQGWDVWTTNNPRKVTKTRAEIEAGLRRIAGGSGSCIDDYSLNSKDDCWNQDALCTQSKCVKFENMGWSEEDLEIVNRLKQGRFHYENLPRDYQDNLEKLRPIFPVIAKYLEEADARQEMFGYYDGFISRLQAIDRQGSVDVLLRLYAESPNFALRKEAREQLVFTINGLYDYYMGGVYTKDEIESLGYSKIMEGLGIKKTAKDECQQVCWLQDALCIEGACKGFNGFNWDSNLMSILRMLKSSDVNDRLSAINRLSNLEYQGSYDLEITQILDSLLMTEVNHDVINGALGTISNLRSPDSIDILIKTLKLGRDSYTRASAANFLYNRNYPEQIIPHLIEAVQMDDEEVKSNAVRSLRYILSSSVSLVEYKEETIELLMPLLADAEGNFRYSIISTLDELMDKDSLLQRFETEQNPSIRRGIVSVLGRRTSSTSSEVNSALIRIFETDPSEDVRIEAESSLANIGSLETAATLLERMNSATFKKEGPYAFIINSIISREKISSNDPIYKMLLSYLRQNAPLLSFISRDEANLMLSIFLILDEKDRNELGFGGDYFISFIPSSRPDEVLEVMRKNPVFERIYSNQKLSGFSPVEKNSISISVYRYLSRYGNIPTNTEIENAIIFILVKRRFFENEVILGRDKYLIVFNHQDSAMRAEPIKEFARKRGVIKLPAIDYLKGHGSKQNIIDTIVNSRTQGETVIWADAHGLPNYVCLGGGVPNQQGNIDEESCLGFRYNEFADILLQRRNLNEVVLIIDSCFSYNFAEQLLVDLSRKNSPSYPMIITETNKGKFGYIGRFQDSLNLLNLANNEPLLGRHIYEAEQFSYESQDSAVFFSEDGISPSLEIAMNTLNPSQCVTCTGDSCPIEPAQETS